MRNIKSNFWFLLLGIAFQLVMAGCSSQLETTILSEKAPPEPEVTQVQEEPIASPQPVVSTTKIEEQDLAMAPSALEVEEPAQPIIRPSSPEIAVATPFAKEREADKPIESLPPVMVDPELPPQPTMRSGSSEEVGMVEPELLKVPQKEKVSQPAQVQPSQGAAGLPPFLFDPELPPDPTFREGPPTEIAKLEPEPIEVTEKEEFVGHVEETPLEVATVQPETLGIPIKTLADVYFDYDRFSLRDDAKNKLNANAQLLVEQLSGQKVVIEGHCDERGTQSYNLILGKRRAETVKQFLVDLGVPEENLDVVSFGKEKPFCTIHTLECWQENRRGHFVLR